MTKGKEAREGKSRDSTEENWLRNEGVARYDAYHRGTNIAQPAAEVFARLRTHHLTRIKD
jgi:hypothetical protein